MVAWKRLVFLGLGLGLFFQALFLLFGTQELSKENRQFVPQAALPEYSDLAILYALEDDSVLGKGQFHYKTRCARCHGFKMQGGDGGPSLTGENDWSRIDNFGSLMAWVRFGNPENGMPAWATRLKEADLFAIAAYILTFSQSELETAD